MLVPMFGRFAGVTFIAAAALGGCGGQGSDADSSDASPSDASAQDSAPLADATTDATADTATTDGASDATPAAGDLVYPGCATPTDSFARTVYVDIGGADTGDGSKGKPFGALSAALAKKKIVPGDHVIVLPGDHGAVSVSKFTNPELAASTSWIWLDFQAGATIKSLAIGDMGWWRVTRAEVSTDRTAAKSGLVTVTSSHDIVIADAHLYTVKDTKSWTAADWINTAADGVFLRNGSCLSLVRTKVLNTRFGVAILSDGKARPDSSMKVLVQGNEIANFSGDGLRPIASDVIIKGNYVHDVYVSAADGDDNHDDGLQMWALGGASYDNIRIDGNWVQESTDAKRTLQNELQGIDDFDGVNTHVVITNNVVLASAYHGIALYGSHDSTIDHNTVANPTTNGHELWVGVFDEKDTTPSMNLTVTDNLATSFSFSKATTGFVNTNNLVVADPTVAYVTFDRTAMLFDLTPKPGSTIAGKGAGSSLVKPPASLP